MTNPSDADRALDERVGDTERNLRAMRIAIRAALLDHKRAGNPVAVWRDNQVMWIAPEDIPEDFDDDPPWVSNVRPHRETAR